MSEFNNGTSKHHDVPALPTGWTSAAPEPGDVEDLVRLLRRHEREARGFPGADSENVAAEVTGRGAQTRTHLILRDQAGVARGWVNCHDRASRRVLVGVTIDPDLTSEVADAVAHHCLAVAEGFAVQIMAERSVSVSHMDSGAFEADERQQRWLTEAGFMLVRHWWQMSRPVTPQERTSLPEPRQGVTITRVRRDDTGMPHEQDLRDIHQVLEDSFADHFNSYREPFEDFVERLREDPGHRWDHWWLASVDGSPAGALVASTTTGHLDSNGQPRPDGSYVEYIGVSAAARGRGVAKGLMYAVIADAAARGRDRVGLEVDADSPTKADQMYTSMGWQTAYVTQSWHKKLGVNEEMAAEGQVS
ncbi:MAG: GNAT family N-acetyltransferase [Ornithinimicrobium sp.]